MYEKTFKRIIDLLLSFVATVCLLPLFVILTIAVKLDSKGSVFFTQDRIGRDKKHFKIFKFRTMRADTPHDVPTHLLADPEMYITRVGKFLRKTSLDELPQLFNIIKGDMAIVGPRPALWNQFDLVELRDRYCANSMRPGLTGWAQINGRDAIDLETKAAFDGYYAQNIGPLMDLRCIFGTIPSVVKRHGVVEGGTGVLQSADEEQTADKTTV